MAAREGVTVGVPTPLLLVGDVEAHALPLAEALREARPLREDEAVSEAVAVAAAVGVACGDVPTVPVDVCDAEVEGVEDAEAVAEAEPEGLGVSSCEGLPPALPEGLPVGEGVAEVPPVPVVVRVPRAEPE